MDGGMKTSLSLYDVETELGILLESSDSGELTPQMQAALTEEKAQIDKMPFTEAEVNEALAQMQRRGSSHASHASQK